MKTASAYRESTGLELTLELGNFCPLACLHCSQDAGPLQTNSLTLEKALKIVMEARSLGAETIAISGGEPLCSPNLIPICEFAKSLDMRVFVYTAGSVIEENMLVPIRNVLALDLARLGVDRVIVNLQAARKQLHDQITARHGSFDNALMSIKKMTSVGLRVEIHFVLMKPNLPELSNVAMLAKELGVKQVNVIRFVPQGRGARNRRLLELKTDDYERLTPIIKRIIVKSEVPIRVSEAFAFFRKKSTRHCNCLAGRKKLVVSGDGVVCPCAAFKGFLAASPAYDVSSRSLLEIWNTRLFQDLREGSDLTRLSYGCPAQQLLIEEKLRPIQIASARPLRNKYLRLDRR